MESCSPVLATATDAPRGEGYVGRNGETVPRSVSPVLDVKKCDKLMRTFVSSDDEIPSYQVHRSSKRFSDRSEEQDSILPISPVRTPPSIQKPGHFTSPLVHTLGTIVKKSNASNVGSEDKVENEKPPQVSPKCSCAFRELGPMDKDISWVSSMETPAPQRPCPDELNTIERATLLPEEELNIHPRALFSPAKMDDCDCKPLTFSSGSEDEARGCLSQKGCEDEVLDNMDIDFERMGVITQVMNGSRTIADSSQGKTAKSECFEMDRAISPISPVFRIKRSKRKSKNKKKKKLMEHCNQVPPAESVSEEHCKENPNNQMCGEVRIENCDINSEIHLGPGQKEDDARTENDLVPEISNSIQDDSFQNLSASFLDELYKSAISGVESDSSRCKTVVDEKDATMRGEKNELLLDKNFVTGKIFYPASSQSATPRPMESLNGFLKSATKLDEGGIVLEKKPDKSFRDQGPTVFSQMMREEEKKCGKRIRPDASECLSPSNYQKSKMMRLNEGGFESCGSDSKNKSSWVTEDLQRMSETIDDSVFDDIIDNLPEDRTRNVNDVGDCRERRSESSVFATSSGKPISPSEDACGKSRGIVADKLEDDAAPENSKMSHETKGFQGFATASGAAVKISQQSLNKVKNMFREFEVEDSLKDNSSSSASRVEGEKTEVKSFQGFTTASGAAVKVSEKSLNKVRSMFREFEVEEDCRNSASEVEGGKTEVKSFQGFTTASGAAVKMSEKSLNKVRSMFRELEAEESFKEDCSNASNKTEGPKEGVKAEVSGFQGFTTASGSAVKVSEKSLNKVRSMFRELEAEESFKEDCSNAPNKTEGPKEGVKAEFSGFQGFTTASGSAVKVSEKSLNKVRSMFREFEVEESFKEDCGKEVNVHAEGEKAEVKSFQGFTTASGAAVKISEKSLNKVRSMFREIEAEDSFKEDCSNSATNVGGSKEGQKTEVSGFQGFATASGSAVKISEKSLNKVRSMFRELEAEDSFKEDYGKEVNVHAEGEKAEVKSFQGFTTASGAAVKISEKSLNKVRSMFRKLEAEDSFKEDYGKEANVHAEGDRAEVKSFQGFATASGSAVNISEKSLNKVRSMFREFEAEDSFKEDCSNSVTNVGGSKEGQKTGVRGFQGFATASGSAVKVSEKSLNKVRSMFREFEAEDSVKDAAAKVRGSNAEDETGEGVEVERFCGFSTASGNATDVSEKALAKAKAFSREDAAVGTKSDSAVVQDEDESREMIPEWLHAYNTSPNLTADRCDMAPVIAREDCGQYSTPREQYLVQSPVLSTTDRFFNKRKRKNPGRKLNFDNSPVTSEQDEDGPRKSDLSRFADFSVPFKRMKTDAGTELSAEVREGRRKARLEQTLAGKKRRVQPVEGSHLTKKKKSKQMSWLEAVQGRYPEQYPRDVLRGFGVRDDVLDVTVANAAEYKFKSCDFFPSGACMSNVEGFPVGDGCSLIFDDDNLAGANEFSRAFFAAPGVQSNLVSETWVKNHYRWIVWKLCHYERSFPDIFGGTCLTPHNVMLQLKYRYDREVDRSHRSALKRILERDDSAAKRIVLCVFDVTKTPDVDRAKNESWEGGSAGLYELGLTDGWYGCYAQTDAAMTRLIEEGKVVVGTKLIVHGAELLNCEQGLSPLEVGASNARLKISTNSTRRAKWWTKLGFRKRSGPPSLPLDSILSRGGHVGRVDVVVTRIYPVLYVERKSDGTRVTRNERAEDRAAAEFQQEQEARLERMYQEARSEMRRREEEEEEERGGQRPRKELSMSNLSRIADAEDLYHLYQKCTDPSTFQNLLTREQRTSLMAYEERRKDAATKELSEMVRERAERENVRTSRRVSRMLRVKMADHRAANTSPGDPVTLTVWNPTEDVLGLLAEGLVVSAFNLVPFANASRCRHATQVNSTRQTHFKELSRTTDYPERRLTRLAELAAADFEAPYGEVDVVGVVVLVRDARYGAWLQQTVYLADSESNYVAVVFWGGCKDLGWDKVLRVGSVVACSNLQWSRNRGPQGIPTVRVTVASAFTENPKEGHARNEVRRLRAHASEAFAKACAEDIVARAESGSEPPSKPKYVNGFRSRPNASSTPLRFASACHDAGEHEPSPIQKRIDRLAAAYGEPPPLSPLLLPAASDLEKFRTKFRVPFKNADARDASA